MLLLGGSEAMKNRKKLAILLPVIVIAAALAYNSIQDRSRNDPNIIRVSGNIEVTDAELSFKISGRVGERLVSEGETIEAGQTVARLESDELTQEVALRNTEVRATEAALAELEAGARPEEVAQAEASVRHAQARLDKLLAGSRFQEVAAAEAAVRRAKAETDRLKTELEQSSELFRARVISTREYDTAQTAYTVAAARQREVEEQRTPYRRRRW